MTDPTVSPAPDKYISSRLANPGAVAALWLAATLLHVADQVRFPDFTSGSPYASSILFLSSAPVLAALFAAFIARSATRALGLAGKLLLVDCLVSACWITAEWALEKSSVDLTLASLPFFLAAIAASAWVVAGDLAGSGATRPGRTLATLAAALVLAAWPCISLFDDSLLGWSARYARPEAGSEKLPPDIDTERLWTSQPALVAKALADLDAPPKGTGATYVVAIGASGTQHLFGREARFASATLARAFRAEGRSITLSNDEDSLHRVPLAANSNLNAVLVGLKRKLDDSNDLVILYLTSHGSRKAELTTDLPNYQRLEPLGAKRLAEALNRAGIRRRVIIVSACFAGGWIKPLASDDTIIIAAARADRTSFGCSDDRDLTYFGEAFLKGRVARGASLSDSFEDARRTIAKWEAQARKRPSEPQAFVGNNMKSVWKAQPGVAASASDR